MEMPKSQAVEKFTEVQKAYVQEIIREVPKADLQEIVWVTGLIDPHVADAEVLDAVRTYWPGVSDLLVSNSAQIDGARISRGDFVLLDASLHWSLGEVWMFVGRGDVEADPFCLLTVHPVQSMRASFAHKSCMYSYEGAKAPILIPASAVRCACIIRNNGGASVVAIWPPAYTTEYVQAMAA